MIGIGIVADRWVDDCRLWLAQYLAQAAPLKPSSGVAAQLCDSRTRDSAGVAPAFRRLNDAPVLLIHAVRFMVRLLVAVLC